jgi:hypothetical protein
MTKKEKLLMMARVVERRHRHDLGIRSAINASAPEAIEKKAFELRCNAHRSPWFITTYALLAVAHALEGEEEQSEACFREVVRMLSLPHAGFCDAITKRQLAELNCPKG